MKPAVRQLLLGGRFSPSKLFMSGEQGAWYDPSDLSTMWQDSAGTTPAVVGQPVGRINDKSGRGNHATQGTAASRPTLQQDASGLYLSFDGSDDSLATAAIDFSATDKMTLIAGIYKGSDAAAAIVCELSDNLSTNNGTFHVLAPTGASPSFGFRSKGTVNSPADIATGYTAPVSVVLSGIGDIAGDSSILRINGAQVAASVSDQGTGNYGNFALYIGRRGGASLPFNGRIYSLIVRGAASDPIQVSRAERHVGSKMGAVL